jgi:hypothetical protein
MDMIILVKYLIVKKSSLKRWIQTYKITKRWIQTYKITKNLTRKIRTPISYKINKDQVKNAVNIVDKNEQITMD